VDLSSTAGFKILPHPLIPELTGDDFDRMDESVEVILPVHGNDILGDEARQIRIGRTDCREAATAAVQIAWFVFPGTSVINCPTDILASLTCLLPPSDPGPPTNIECCFQNSL
jgi:hypothetical protein